jgi:hypothetical protein
MPQVEEVSKHGLKKQQMERKPDDDDTVMEETFAIRHEYTRIWDTGLESGREREGGKGKERFSIVRSGSYVPTRGSPGLNGKTVELS